MTVWIDVEDMLRFADGHARPTGIQRLAFEMCGALVARYGSQVRFLRHVPGRLDFRTVRWTRLLAAFAQGEAPPSHGEARQALAALLRSLRAPDDADGDFTALVRPGDTLLAVGSPWFDTYPARIRAAQARHGMRFAVVLYDLIPLVRPEFAGEGIRHAFAAWVRGCMPLADHVFAISRSTAADMDRFAAREGMALRGRPVAIPVGAGFRPPPPGEQRLRDGLPAPGSYVLTVSTIEPRKNHDLLVRVWRRLLARMPRAAVPRLVFAGRIGWLVDDFMQQLRNLDFLDGWVVHLPDATDRELEALYRGCLFSAFPSFYEGWGLPVTESLAFGKPCVSSNTSSLPEAGGALGRYFDPEDIGAATTLIHGLIEDRAGLAAWEAQVRRDFRPVSWQMTADAIMAELEGKAE